MIAIRRSGDSLGARKLHGFQSSGKHVLENRLLIRGKLAKDMANHFAGLAAADSEFQPGELVAPEVLEDGFDAVVSAGRAFFAEAEGAEGEGNVIVNDQHLLRLPFVE